MLLYEVKQRARWLLRFFERVRLTNLSVKVVAKHMQSLACPCASFDEASDGKCKRDGRICDLLTERVNGTGVTMSSCL
jgi:hypothetical protein